MEEGADGPLLALRDQLCERGIPNHCKGRRLRVGVSSVAEKAREPVSGMHHGVERKQTFR